MLQAEVSEGPREVSLFLSLLELIDRELPDLRPRAEEGDGKAQYGLGRIYMVGLGRFAGLAGLSQAAKWYERPAEQGFAAAQFMMGFLYEHGKGVRRDYARALDHYRSAADQGHATAANNLATLYLHHWASECGAFESSV